MEKKKIVFYGKKFIRLGYSTRKRKKTTDLLNFKVFSFTNKIRRLTLHLELHKSEFLSQRGLRKILEKRQRLLDYLSKKNRVRYKKLISQLGIRESKTR